MARRIKQKINTCSKCGTILDKGARIKKILADANEALDRFYHKHTKKRQIKNEKNINGKSRRF